VHGRTDVAGTRFRRGSSEIRSVLSADEMHRTTKPASTKIIDAGFGTTVRVEMAHEIYGAWARYRELVTSVALGTSAAVSAYHPGTNWNPHTQPLSGRWKGLA
jgi:hypothetical protein